MRTANMHEAKTHLFRLVEEVVNGEPFIIAHAGKPLVQVAAVTDEAPALSRIGFLDGQFKIPDDIKKPFEAEINEMFYGTEDKRCDE